MTFALVDTGLQLTIVDDGPELNPLTLPEPDLTAPLEDRHPGGLGVHLVKHLCDRVDYTRRDGLNQLILTCLHLATGRMALANAGHNLPYLVRRNGDVEIVTAANGLALGVMEDATFPLTELAVAPGDALLAYTDGVCDAIDPAGSSFGTDGLERQLRLVAQQPPDLIVNSLFEAVEAHAGDAGQEDDITIVAIRYYGPQDETMA